MSMYDSNCKKQFFVYHCSRIRKGGIHAGVQGVLITKTGRSKDLSVLDFFRIFGFAEGFWCYTVGFLEQLIKVGYGRKSYIITNGKNGVIGILQLKGRLLQTNLVQIFGHCIAGILAKTAAKIGLVEMERL